MAEKPDQDPSGRASGKPREDRLKAALKANLAKRKAQARVRADGDDRNANSAAVDRSKTKNEADERSDKH